MFSLQPPRHIPTLPIATCGPEMVVGRFRSIAEVAGPAACPTRSRMTDAVEKVTAKTLGNRNTQQSNQAKCILESTLRPFRTLRPVCNLLEWMCRNMLT
jgi:hypothetical protein